MNEPVVKKSSVLKKALFITLTLLLVVLTLTYLVFQYTYSEGNRAGVLIKFSKKGYVFKTYEGELNIGGLGNIPSTAQMNQIWEFSVLDASVAEQLMQMEGKRVSLQYKEKVKNMPWQGETKYFVTGVEELKP